MQGCEVIDTNDGSQGLHREQRQVIEREVGDQIPLQFAVQHRPIGWRGDGDVAKAYEVRGVYCAQGAETDIASAER
ncbi:hypothetical protein D3C78_1743020 [compost metagenome]